MCIDPLIGAGVCLSLMLLMINTGFKIECANIEINTLRKCHVMVNTSAVAVSWSKLVMFHLVV